MKQKATEKKDDRRTCMHYEANSYGKHVLHILSEENKNKMSAIPLCEGG